MRRAQILIIVIGALLVVGIYQLPKVVVENEALEEAEQLSQSTETPADHVMEMDSLAALSAVAIRQLLVDEENPKIRINFADSLGRTYLKYNQVDSALKYARYIFEIDSGFEGRLKAGLLLYSAFELTNSGAKATQIGEQVRTYLEPVLEESQDLSIQVKVGMTYMSTGNPMQGVMMIREVLEKDPQNIEALFNLGFLAIQSGQFERAIERFETVIDLEPENWNAKLYLGISQMELGQVDKAKNVFEEVVNKSNSEVLKQIASGYLKEIK